MSGSNGADRLGPAIAAVETPQVELRQWTATIASTGRPATILLPADASDGEIAEFCGWVLSSVMAAHRVEREKASAGRILVPTHQLVRA